MAFRLEPDRGNRFSLVSLMSLREQGLTAANPLSLYKPTSQMSDRRLRVHGWSTVESDVQVRVRFACRGRHHLASHCLSTRAGILDRAGVQPGRSPSG